MGKSVAIILAAGKGSRMKNSTPKPLIEVFNKPMIEWIICKFNELNIDVIVVINPKDQSFFKKYTNVKLVYQIEQRGTGHAVQQAIKAVDNYESVSDVVQNKLRVLLEKSMKTSKIIIITQRYNQVIDPLKSRFLNIRIPVHKIYDKFLYFKNLLLKHMFIIDDDILMNIIKKHSDIDYNFINILGYFKTKQIHGDVYDEIIEKYICIIKSDKNICKKITDIKQLLYLAKSVVNVNIFLRRLLSHLLNLNYDNKQKIKIIKEFTEYDIMINKSFRDLLCLEGLLVGISGV